MYQHDDDSAMFIRIASNAASIGVTFTSLIPIPNGVNQHLQNVHELPNFHGKGRAYRKETDIILHFRGDYAVVSNFNPTGVQGERLPTRRARARERIA